MCRQKRHGCHMQTRRWARRLLGRAGAGRKDGGQEAREESKYLGPRHEGGGIAVRIERLRTLLAPRGRSIPDTRTEKASKREKEIERDGESDIERARS
eukprot:738559-Rhodomonas_salina.2